MKINKYNHQKGNVLFLILIAVALFAALSYAVTQSSRSGGDASRETNVINTASLTQYPNQVRTSVLRMIISSLDPLQLLFNRPDQMDSTANSAAVAAPTRGVFNTLGGAASYQQVPMNLTRAGTAPMDWKFNMDFEIPQLGTSVSSSGAGNELIAFADDITSTICARVNQDLGYGNITIPTAAAGTIANNRFATTTLPTDPTTEIVLTSIAPASPNWFENKAFGCFQNTTDSNHFVFYYVLAER